MKDEDSVPPMLLLTRAIDILSNYAASPDTEMKICSWSEDILLEDLLTWLTNEVESYQAKELQKNDYNLPSHNAVAQILRDYLCVDTEATPKVKNVTIQEKKRPVQRAQAAKANKSTMNQTFRICQPQKRSHLHDSVYDPISAEITNCQTKELENYRSAMSRMAADIITLRTQVLTLETENSQLRTHLHLNPDLGRHLLDDADIAVMTKAEIADHMASLKFKLTSETNKAAVHRDRIQQLQNELIKKNDSEKELLRLKGLHQSGHPLQQQQHHQQEGRQENQENVATIEALEATVRRQGKVIEKMEKAVISKPGEKKRQSDDKSLVQRRHLGKTDWRTREVELATQAENSRLQEELDKIHRQPFPVTVQESAKEKTTRPLQESLSLLSKLKRAEARIQTLEAQMVENCKVWGQKTQELLSRLDEYKHGMVHSEDTLFPNDSSERKVYSHFNNWSK